jgi:uncharacterized protein YkuJ
MIDKEPERYWDWMLWKNRQEDAKMKEKGFDEYGNYGENNGPVGDWTTRKSIDDATPEEWDAVFESYRKSGGGLSLDPSGNELYRRELLATSDRLDAMQNDMAQLTKDYYKLINRIKELSEENSKLKRQISELRHILD